MPFEVGKSPLELLSLQTKTFMLATLIRKGTIQQRHGVLLAGPGRVRMRQEAPQRRAVIHLEGSSRTSCLLALGLGPSTAAAAEGSVSGYGPAVDAGARRVRVPALDDRGKSRAIRASTIHRGPRNCEPEVPGGDDAGDRRTGNRSAAGPSPLRGGERRSMARVRRGENDSTPFEQPRHVSERRRERE
jgi:hypothetical protein